MDFKQKLMDKINLVDKYLEIYLPERENYQKNIYHAMKYSIFAGGKRLRPVITLACCEIVGGNEILAIPFGCAIEMIHTYSLIHDDLPAMDNDDYRRGKLTNHKVFGEAIAILAGDALLNKAFEIMTEESLKNNIDLRRAMHAMSVIAKASGSEGMIGGQVVDLEAENKTIDRQHLEYMHLHKTGALIMAAAEAGAIIGGAAEDELQALKTYSKNIGLAFQIKDDILDIEGVQEKLGKPTGSDINNNKSTFITLMGMDKSKTLVESLTQEAIEQLKIFDDRACFLTQLAQYLVNRET
ncbi:MAG: Polyprenyl synthetase [Clostridia bacterium]|jgi:geranylgeranyl diphosphate synthase type II|uniref:polyprenyl synthetase family protein n=1 Tax=Petroclostridium xylanilyticum TaxID=1792311 RepID=UPI000B98D8CE|nr:farnesyl diphosphate synthase [Petroclostridium xylanilyticum]MBZ4644745.1 Polyprenyl synthetase [Clostridia bacterium]